MVLQLRGQCLHLLRISDVCCEQNDTAEAANGQVGLQRFGNGRAGKADHDHFGDLFFK